MIKQVLIILFVLSFSIISFGQQNYNCTEKSIEITFSAANDGKFRFKTRDENTAFGKTFAARQKPFGEKVYLEWQIGYDALVEDVKSGKKTTKLMQEKFVGSTGREKYPYELSEILYELIKCGLVSREEFDKLASEILTFKKFIDEKEIEVEKPVNAALNGVNFKETAIKLPTLFMPQTDGTQIEVSIQKQQYASGVQPMIYFCIPFKSFADWKVLDGKKSVKGNTLKYVIKKENAEVILNMFRVFGMASSRHKFDVEQIFKTLKKLG